MGVFNILVHLYINEFISDDLLVRIILFMHNEEETLINYNILNSVIFYGLEKKGYVNNLLLLLLAKKKLTDVLKEYIEDDIYDYEKLYKFKKYCIRSLSFLRSFKIKDWPHNSPELMNINWTHEFNIDLLNRLKCLVKYFGIDILKKLNIKIKYEHDMIDESTENIVGYYDECIQIIYSSLNDAIMMCNILFEIESCLMKGIMKMQNNRKIGKCLKMRSHRFELHKN